MAEIFQKRTLSGWSPADEPSEAEWRKQRVGCVYRATVVKPRNYKHHCLFMVLLNEVTFPNQEKFTSARQFRRAVAFAAGHCGEMMTLDGEIIRFPLPYDYDTIPDEDDFTKAFGAAMTVCSAILRVTCPDLEEEVSRYANEQYGIECPRIFRDAPHSQEHAA
jgi:hypothetical protein